MVRSASSRVSNHEATVERAAILRDAAKMRGPSQDEVCWHGSNPRHHHVFDLDIFLHAVMGAFTSETGFLDAAERRYFGGDQPGVDADHAGFQRFGYPPDPAEIARIEIRGEPERRVVAHRD